MAAPVIANPSVADRHNSNWWVAPIGVGEVVPNVILVSDLPTSDPAVKGALWNDSNVITVSTAT